MDGLTPRPQESPQAAARASGDPVAVTVDYWPHPLTEDGRDTHTSIVPAGTALAELIRLEAGASLGDVAEVLVDGAGVPQAEWDGREVRDGQVVTVRTGAEGDFQRAIAQLAVLAAAVFLPGALGLTGVVSALTSAAISVVGGLIVNALFPVRQPEIGGGAQPDPIYSLAGGSNRARAYEPLPLVLGEHRVFPDLAAKEYTEFDGDDQFLYQIFNFGPGDLDISDLRIDSSPVTDYAEVTTEHGDAQGRIALVAGNVDTAAGATLDDTDWVTRQTGAGTNRIQIDITGRLFRLDKKGREKAQSVTLQIRWWKVGESPPANPIQPLITNDSQTPVRRSLYYVLPEKATWNVSVRRITAPSDEDRVYDEIAFSALRSYQPDAADYTGQNRLGIKIRASGQLSGRLDRVSALVKQKISIWDADDESWGATNVESSNPAALFVWYTRGVRIAGRPAAGVGLPDSRIDLAGLGAWYEWCTAQGLRCDYEIKSGMTHDAVLALIAQCGRASVSWQTGKLGVVYEDENRDPSGLVTPGNVVKGSFRYEYAQGEIADEVIVRYIEPDLDWQYNSVRRTRPGLVGTPQSSVTVTAKGVTQREQAAVECNLQTARQHYHRRRLVWEMGREGRSLTKGSVVHITHSLIDGGITGRLKEIVSATELRLDRAVDVGSDDYLMLRLSDGTLHQSRVTRPADQPATSAIDDVGLADALPDKALAAEPVDVIWRLYDNALPPTKARIVAFEPVSDRRFRLTAINEVDAYYRLATSDLTAPFPSVVFRLPLVLAVQFSAVRVRQGDTYGIDVHAALTVAHGWRGGVVRAGADASSLRVVDRLVGGDTDATWAVPSDVTGQVVEIVPGTEQQATGPVWRGRWDQETIAPPEPTGFAVREIQGKIREFTCVPPDIPDLVGVHIRFSNEGDLEWDAMTSLSDGPIGSFPYHAFKPGAGSWTFEARTETTGGELSTGVRISAVLNDLPATFAGRTWHTVTSEPPAMLGENGDFALRLDGDNLGILYEKRSGAWVQVADLAGADG
ncbi:MAG: host specificity factor TipJ family phage tail protein, partial [Acidobacteriota bacterium]|nr:host specificity factor TipJ family phage tail protein [Acidobacteriota bacterium]